MKTRIVCITGCSRGLGRAMAEEFAAKGWMVAGCARSRTAIDELNATHRNNGHYFCVCDTSDAESVSGFAHELIRQLGAPDLLLNNAAIINRNAPLWEIEPEEFSEVIDVNLKGVHNVIHYLVPKMIERKTGIVVNFSSGWGRSTAPDVAPYCASKWAIEGLSQALAQELPAGMASVALNPGIIDTDMLKSCFGGSSSAFPSATQWAESAVPFLQSLSGSDNGQALTAPGG